YESAAADFYARPDERIAGEAPSLRTRGDQHDRPPADGGNRLVAVDEMPDDLIAARKVAQINRRASARQQQAVVLRRIDVIECGVRLGRVPGPLDAVVPAFFLLMKHDEQGLF